MQRSTDPPRGADGSRPIRAVLNPPNVLSLIRILLVPLLVVLLLTKFRFPGQDLAGLAVFLIASLTDFLDGFIARRRGMITRLGKLLDPAADKILTSAALISLVELERAPAWIVVVILAREVAISSLRSVAASTGVVLAAIPSAKLKTVLQVVAIALLILYPRLGDWQILAIVALWGAMLLGLYSGTEYFVRHGPSVFAEERNG